MHTGFAAEGGVVAAEIAADGATGAADIMETRFGWFDAAAGGFLPEEIDGRLGAPWAIVDPGTWIKPYPSGSLTHPAMTLLSNLMAKHRFTADDVASVTVTTNRRLASTLIHNRPADAMQARFSMPFGLAALLVAGRAGLAEFTDGFVNRADVKAVMERIDYRTYETVEPGFTNVTSFVEVTLTDGTVHKGRADFAKGSTQAPMSYEDASDKFLGCAAAADWPEDRARQVVETVSTLEALADIRALTRHLTA
jgi:2-methylcitrate dehydratase PrpD